MFKFVQSGDFHLDSPLESFEDSDARRLMLLDSFGQVVKSAREFEADLLFLAGDLFDNDGIRRETIDFLLESIRSIPDVKVLAVAGNHDHVGRGDAWNELSQLENFFLFTDFETLFLEDPGVIVHGASFMNRTEPQSILPELAELDRAYPNVLLMHGDIAASSLYNPLGMKELTPFDHCALGHRHEFQVMGPRGNIVYAGNPCARNFLETGSKGCVQGIFDDGRLTIEFKPFSFPAYHDLVLEVSGHMTHASIRDAIGGLIASANDYYRITLKGFSQLELNLEYLKKGISAGGIKLIDDTRRPRDLKNIQREETLQGEFTRRMLELSEVDDKAMEALEAGLDALEGSINQ